MRACASPPERDVKVFSAAPVLRVANTGTALKFYRDVLGFTVEFQYDDYVGLSFGEAGLHLCRPEAGKPAGGGAVYVFCDEIDGYFGKIRSLEATPEGEPADRMYAMRDFAICDPDGNRLTFGCSLDKEDCEKA
jgi:catechol 2,3-dioxygenase-like lactoylglutathione lyase family enzyme